ncbi:uncharacterized protein LOC129319536 [Prosopis cineraria]|uniref:uncharacterized protein LOC129319536 n=1 Tax=Prosopis cineraria TaxID=364024 RepID=UPI0024102078|nr:uncharacterized protein LOC129319536 [Prosopis cineraria]
MRLEYCQQIALLGVMTYEKMCHKLRVAAKHGKEAVPVLLGEEVSVEDLNLNLFIEGQYREEEARASLNLISSMIFVYGHKLEALFNSGAMHSFVFEEYVDRLNLSLQELLVLIKVTKSSKSSSIATKACQGVETQFKDRIFKINLICISMRGIDVIIGTDWLATNNDALDCAKKVVLLLVLGAIVDSSEQPKFLSIVSVEKLIQQGCDTYMVFFSASTVYDGRIEKIGVASEFPKVFFSEVTRLPPKKDVEFSIDLVPETESISKASYRMSPSELAELKKQIEDFLEKGFIRSSVSL